MTKPKNPIQKLEDDAPFVADPEVVAPDPAELPDGSEAEAERQRSLAKLMEPPA